MDERHPTTGEVPYGHFTERNELFPASRRPNDEIAGCTGRMIGTFVMVLVFVAALLGLLAVAGSLVPGGV